MIIKGKELKSIRKIAKEAGTNMMSVIRAYEQAAKGNLVNAAKLFLLPKRYNTKSDKQPANNFVSPEGVITQVELVQSDTHKSESKGVGRAWTNGVNFEKGGAQ